MSADIGLAKQDLAQRQQILGGGGRHAYSLPAECLGLL